MMKLTKKIIQLEDGEVGIQFEPEQLKSLGWKEGDEFEWIPTKEGYKLMKVNTGITVEAELDDRALDIASFIQQLSELHQDKERLDWILNNYTLSCGITREEVDEKMAKLAELRNATKAELRNATKPLW